MISGAHVVIHTEVPYISTEKLNLFPAPHGPESAIWLSSYLSTVKS